MGNFNDCQLSDDAHAKVLHVNALGVGEVQSQQSSDSLVSPPGFEPRLIHNSVQSVEMSRPTGVKVSTKMKIRTVRQSCTSKNHSVCLGKRVTRGQSKKCKEQTERRMSMRSRGDLDSEGEEESPLTTESVKTTESMRKLAEESLEVGELLGLKVIANKENAIKRITQRLKNARVPQSIHKTK